MKLLAAFRWCSEWRTPTKRIVYSQAWRRAAKCSCRCRRRTGRHATASSAIRLGSDGKSTATRNLLRNDPGCAPFVAASASSLQSHQLNEKSLYCLSSAPSMRFASGAGLGPFEILAPLGAGGMGEVYRARDTRLERTVALKILPSELVTTPSRRVERFRHEARVIARITHPNICTLHDVGEDAPAIFLVMEYVDGTTLARRLEDGPLPSFPRHAHRHRDRRCA